MRTSRRAACRNSKSGSPRGPTRVKKGAEAPLLPLRVTDQPFDARARRPFRPSSPPVPELAAAPPEPLVALAPDPEPDAPALLEPAPVDEPPLLALAPVLAPEPALVPAGAAAPDPGP